MQLGIADHGRESLLLNRGRAQLDSRENRCVQNVDTGVDAVSNELDRLLDEAVNTRRVVGLVNDDTILGGLLDLGDNDGALVTVCLVEVGQLLKRVLASDIGVQDEEGSVILEKRLLGQLQRTGGA